MASEVAICNLALAQIGQTQFLQALDEDSDAAGFCNAFYAQNRDETLQELPWAFATQRATPAPLVATTLDLGVVPTGWGYAFALPADAVSKGLQRIYDTVRNPRVDQEVPFAIEYDAKLGALIVLTDAATPEFVYTAQVTDPDLFPPDFIRALAWNLSVDLAVGLRKDPKLGQMAQAAYMAALANARRSSLMGGGRDLEPVPAHIAARS